MRKRLRLLALAVSVLLLAAACGSRPTVPVSTPVSPTLTLPAPTTPPPSATLAATVTTIPTTALPTSTPSPDVTITPPLTPAAKPTPEARIILSQVSPSELSPGVVRVAGKAQVFEAMLVVELVGPAGDILATGYVRTSAGAPEWGEFAVDLFYPPPAVPIQATLQAYEPSPKDGSPNSLVTAPVVLVAAPELDGWQTFTNATHGFALRYPPSWHLNQGSVMPAPPAATKLSTYQVQTPGQLPGEKDAEVWITVSDQPSVAEMESLAKMGYRQATVVVGGRPGIRYTAGQPFYGAYDVIYTISGRREYRIQLSSSGHEYDPLFNLLLATFSITE